MKATDLLALAKRHKEYVTNLIDRTVEENIDNVDRLTSFDVELTVLVRGDGEPPKAPTR